MKKLENFWYQVSNLFPVYSDMPLPQDYRIFLYATLGLVSLSLDIYIISPNFPNVNTFF